MSDAATDAASASGAPMPDDGTLTDEHDAHVPTRAKKPEVRGHVIGIRPDEAPETVFHLADVRFFYGKYRALQDVTFDIQRNEITALIGPSGCGKSTLLRCLNRMNDLIPGARLEGNIT